MAANKERRIEILTFNIRFYKIGNEDYIVVVQMIF